MRILTMAFVGAISISAQAADTGYQKIEAIKAWSNRIEIQLAERHRCERAPRDHYRLFLHTANYEILAALLMTAYSREGSISVSYICESGHARVSGVRAN